MAIGSARSFPLLSCKVIAYGAWGPGFASHQQLTKLFSARPADGLEHHPAASLATTSDPKPKIIPANERRRAPLLVRLAVESSWQATTQAGIDPKALSCVFVSGFGDTQLTDYMCKVLATDNKQLSPTKFHNSVHNAAAGYWTISTGSKRAANSVAGFQESVPLAIMEAVVQCNQESEPILITFYDVPVSDVLTGIMGPGSAFAFSVVIAPIQSHYQGHSLNVAILPEQHDWPPLQCQHALLQQLYTSSPAGRILAVVEKFCMPTFVSNHKQESESESESESEKAPKTITMPLGKGTSLMLKT